MSAFLARPRQDVSRPVRHCIWSADVDSKGFGEKNKSSRENRSVGFVGGKRFQGGGGLCLPIYALITVASEFSRRPYILGVSDARFPKKIHKYEVIQLLRLWAFFGIGLPAISRQKSVVASLIGFICIFLYTYIHKDIYTHIYPKSYLCTFLYINACKHIVIRHVNEKMKSLSFALVGCLPGQNSVRL